MAWFRLAKWPTGKLRHRVGFGKRLVLQIEIEKTYEGGESRLIWRDARVEDMSYTEVRRVSKPHGQACAPAISVHRASSRSSNEPAVLSHARSRIGKRSFGLP